MSEQIALVREEIAQTLENTHTQIAYWQNRLVELADESQRAQVNIDQLRTKADQYRATLDLLATAAPVTSTTPQEEQ